MSDDLSDRDHLAEQAASVAVLADPVRRSLYRFVVSQYDAVSREQAATALDVPLHSVKFHLDRLMAAGLLDVEFRRLSGRTGPGAGRPAKLFRRSHRQVTVCLPERRYDLVGEILAEAVDRSLRDASPLAEAVLDVATDVGRGFANENLGAARSKTDDDLGAVARVLDDCGYEPHLDSDELCLTNCPFDRLATAHTSLVCGLNLALVGGMTTAVGATSARARLAPTPGFCCVRISH